MAKSSPVLKEPELATQPVKVAPSVHKRLRQYAANHSCSLGEAIEKLLNLHGSS